MASAAAIGEAQVRRYQPRRPTTSPYLNLTRLNTGAVPNYYSLVRPAQQQQEFNNQEQSLRKKQSGSILRLQNDVQRGLQPLEETGRRSTFNMQGSRGRFGYNAGFFMTRQGN